MATSAGQNDSGMFELNFRDERCLPFEDAGAISEWQLELLQETNLLDPKTIADVIFHVKYTAREGGAELKRQALAEVVNTATLTGTRLFSARQEFPDSWHAFLNPPDQDPYQRLALSFTRDRFPMRVRSRKQLGIARVDVLLKLSDTPPSNAVDAPSKLYNKGAPLEVAFGVGNLQSSVPNTHATLAADPSIPGAGHASFDHTRVPIISDDWQLAIKAQLGAGTVDGLDLNLKDTGGALPRLVPATIDDIWLLVKFLAK